MWGADLCLWPEPYSVDSAESAHRFLVECCWTYNEAGGSIELIPDIPHVGAIASEWWETRREGRPLVIEKSRRLVVSWILRGLELWAMGMRREKRTIAGLNYPKSAEHVWRVWHLYDRLCRSRPEFGLAPCTPRGGSVAAQELDQVLLPNGSLVESLNQEGQSFQGSGYSGVTMEEFSLYRRCEYMYAQAVRVCEGIPGQPGGHVVIVTNASPSKEWQGIKGV